MNKLYNAVLLFWWGYSKCQILRTPSLPYFKSSWTKCLKNQPYAVIKIKEMTGEVEKKHKKRDGRHKADFVKQLLLKIITLSKLAAFCYMQFKWFTSTKWL